MQFKKYIYKKYKARAKSASVMSMSMSKLDVTFMKIVKLYKRRHIKQNLLFSVNNAFNFSCKLVRLQLTQPFEIIIELYASKALHTALLLFAL